MLPIDEINKMPNRADLSVF